MASDPADPNSLPPITGKAQHTLQGVALAPVPAWRGYYEVGRDCACAMRCLRGGTAAYILAAQATECLLKAIIAKSVGSAPHGHHLVSLWADAANSTYIDKAIPAWVTQLNDVWDKPFALRYPKGHGIVLPDKSVMMSGVRALSTVVKQRIS